LKTNRDLFLPLFGTPVTGQGQCLRATLHSYCSMDSHALLARYHPSRATAKHSDDLPSDCAADNTMQSTR
jgi:hypothetical protein